GETDTIAHGRAEHLGVLAAGEFQGHRGCSGHRDQRGGTEVTENASVNSVLPPCPLCSWSGCFEFRFRIELAVDSGVQAEDLAEAGEGDELDALGVAGLEAHGGARGNVEPETARRGAVEAERFV